MDVAIREMGALDRDLWAELYGFLYPDHPKTSFLKEIDRILRADNRMAYVAEYKGKAVGFAEYAERPYVNGCVAQPVPFLEGIWVHETYRRRGVAGALLAHLEALALARGFDEMGSDVLLENASSHEAHARWGFEETERVVFYRKSLGQA